MYPKSSTLYGLLMIGSWVLHEEWPIHCQRPRPDPVTYISTTNHAANSLAIRLLWRDWLDTNRDGVVVFTITQHFQTKWN